MHHRSVREGKSEVHIHAKLGVFAVRHGIHELAGALGKLRRDALAQPAACRFHRFDGEHIRIPFCTELLDLGVERRFLLGKLSRFHRGGKECGKLHINLMQPVRLGGDCACQKLIVPPFGGKIEAFHRLLVIVGKAGRFQIVLRIGGKRFLDFIDAALLLCGGRFQRRDFGVRLSADGNRIRKGGGGVFGNFKAVPSECVQNFSTHRFQLFGGSGEFVICLVACTGDEHHIGFIFGCCLDQLFKLGVAAAVEFFTDGADVLP